MRRALHRKLLTQSFLFGMSVGGESAVWPRRLVVSERRRQVDRNTDELFSLLVVSQVFHPSSRHPALARIVGQTSVEASPLALGCHARGRRESKLLAIVEIERVELRVERKVGRTWGCDDKIEVLTLSLARLGVLKGLMQSGSFPGNFCLAGEDVD
jgi:hypothetical protein